MDLPSELSLIHQPTRLRIVGFLYRHRDVSSTGTRNLLELSDGNLASHVEKLEEAGYVENRRALAQNGFETRYRMTRSGVSAFRTYMAELRQFLEEVDST